MTEALEAKESVLQTTRCVLYHRRYFMSSLDNKRPRKLVYVQPYKVFCRLKNVFCSSGRSQRPQKISAYSLELYKEFCRLQNAFCRP